MVKYYNKKTNIFNLYVLLFLTLVTIFSCICNLITDITTKANTNNLSTITSVEPLYNFSGTGTQSNPYIIKTAADLKGLATNVNNGTTYQGKYIKLNNDIDLNKAAFTPIGHTKSFYGTFDGSNYKISNINIQVSSSYAGLFGSIKNATIQNLTINGGSVKQTAYAGKAGGIAGYMHNSKIINCVNLNVSIEIETNSGFTAAGGIVGYSYSTSSINSINRCTNYASVNNDNYSNIKSNAGGILGGSAYGTTNISLCKNFGTIECGTRIYSASNYSKNDFISTEYPYSGGIVGHLYKGTIEKCCNYGEITSGTSFNTELNDGKYIDRYPSDLTSRPYGATRSYAGGICAYSPNNITINYCFNKGKITSNANADIKTYKFLLSGIYQTSDGTYWERSGINNDYDTVFNIPRPGYDYLDTYNSITYGPRTSFSELVARKHDPDCRRLTLRFPDIDDDCFQFKNIYDIKAYAYGIGYNARISNCYNDSQVVGGFETIEYVFQLVCWYEGNGMTDSYCQYFNFNFNSGGRFGPISNNNNTCYYASSKFTPKIKLSFYTFNYSYTKMFIFNALSYEKTFIVEGTSCNEQRFTIRKPMNSDGIYFEIDERGEGKVNIIEKISEGGYELFSGKDYMTFSSNYNDNEFYLYGTSQSDDELKNIYSDDSVWGRADYINGGTPYIKEMYW